jgi:hypothetical protein
MRIRKEIVLDTGIPALYQNGFEKSPYSDADFGWHPSLGYFFELCRLRENSVVERVRIDVVKGDRWIKVWLNAFKLTPIVKNLTDLKNIDGIKFRLPPCSSSKMRIHVDDRKGIPLFDIENWKSAHKLGKSITDSGPNQAIKSLSENIQHDLKNIDQFFKRWYELHVLSNTTWDGILKTEPV